MPRSPVLIVSALAVAASGLLAVPATAAVRPPAMAVVLATSNAAVGRGGTVVLSARGTHAAAGRRLVRYVFDAGDRLAPQTGTHVPRFLHHHWVRAGHYPVSLTVVDDHGTKATARLTVTVS